MSLTRRIVSPAECGEVGAIASKSELHRALIAASLCEGQTEILFRGLSEDILATVSSLSALGAEIQMTLGGCTVRYAKKPEKATLDVGESGSTLRFLLPVAAAMGVDATFLGRGRLGKRPIAPLTLQLEAHGAKIIGSELPLRVGAGLRAGRFELSGNISSQFVTGLLLAMPLLGTEASLALTTPLESAAYVDVTRSVLSAFGVTFDVGEGEYRLVPGSAYRSPGRYTVEGDWSNAAFHLVSGAIGGDVSVSGLSEGSLQADRAVLDALRLAGATPRLENRTVRVAAPERLSAFDFDVSGCPDLFPILCVLAAACEGESHLFGGARLRYKESDRIASTEAMLRALGASVFATEDGMTVLGGRRLSGGVIDGAGDHRIVMAGAVARSLCGGDVIICGADAVSKSYPAFFDDFASLKGESYEI